MRNPTRLWIFTVNVILASINGGLAAWFILTGQASFAAVCIALGMGSLILIMASR